jgi:hypothetical protein
MKSLILATLATTALATQAISPEYIKRNLVAIQARQTFDTGCLTAILSVYSSAPTPPPEIASYESAHPQTDPCSFSTPDSLSAQFSTYQSQVMSWFGAHSSELYAALSQCPIATKFATAVPVCTNTAAGAPKPATNTAGMTTSTTAATSAGTGSAVGGSTSTASGASGASTSATKNVGARETGMVAAAIAAAGFLGAVAAL